jgi:hypothetical protein
MRTHVAAFVLVAAGTSVLAAQQPQPQPPPTPNPGTSQTSPATPPSQPAAPPGAQPAAPQPPQAGGRVFGAEAGMIFNPIKPDKTTDFEHVMARLHEALARSEDPVRRQQAAGWRVFKSVEPGPNANALYIFVMDPAVKGADYTVSKILAEVFPAEAQELYKLYSAAYAGGQSLVNLQLVENFALPYTPPATAPRPPR